MTKEETLAALLRLDAEQEMEWMIGLGMNLTICARGAYPFEQTPGDLQRLIGIHELHHKVYARIGDVRRGDVWRMESFFAGLIEKTTYYRFVGELHWAITNALPKRGIQE